MVPGIDPRIDIAFKRVFGSQEWRHLTRALIDAVLQPSPWNQLLDLEILNPYTEQIKLDDKLSILDVKARDDQGRLFNIEMQMVASPSVGKRFLYYWSRLYGTQLMRGDDYSQLCPTISICFVNGLLFSDRATYHRRFQLFDRKCPQFLTDDLEIHIIELPNFDRPLEELRKPLDLWLYFLKNGVELDADSLPAPLDTDDLCQAMGVLKMFSQDEMARELYEGRLKAWRDARMLESDMKTLESDKKMLESDIKNALAQIAAAQQQKEELERGKEELERGKEELERGKVEAERGKEEAERRKEEAERRQEEAERGRAEAEEREAESARRARQELARTIRLCERLLNRPVTDDVELSARDVDALRDLADRLEEEVVQSRL